MFVFTRPKFAIERQRRKDWSNAWRYRKVKLVSWEIQRHSTASVKRVLSLCIYVTFKINCQRLQRSKSLCSILCNHKLNLRVGYGLPAKGPSLKTRTILFIQLYLKINCTFKTQIKLSA